MSVRANECNFQTGVRFFDFADEFNVACEPHGGGEQNEELILFADLDGLLPIDLGRRGVKQAAARNHAGGAGQPNRVPVGLDLAGCGPPRNSTAVEILKAWRIQQQSLHYIRHSSPSVTTT